MDFDSLSRRELQALCKSNGIRANMANAAMAEALRCLPSVTADRTDEIGRTAPPPPRSALKDLTNMEEQTQGSRLPRGGRARAKTKMVAAGDTEEGVPVPDQASLTLQGRQWTTVPPEAAEAIREGPEHGCPLLRGGRARGKTRKPGARKTEEEGEVVVPAPDALPGNKRTVAGEAAAAPVDAEEAAMGMKTRRSARPKVKIALDQKEDLQAAAARKEQKADSSAAAIASAVVSDKSCGDSEEHALVTVVVPAPDALPGNKRTVAGEAASEPVDAEEAAMGMRTRRSARSKVKIALDQKEEDVQAAAAQKEQKADSSGAAIASAVVSDKSCGDFDEHAVVTVVEGEIAKPQEGQNMTRRAVPHETHEDLQQDQRTVEEVAMVKKKTRRSTRAKVAVAAQKGQKADSSETTIGPEVDLKDDEVVPKVGATKPQEGEEVTRRAAPYMTHEDLQQDQRTVEEVAMAKKRTRRSTRSKVASAAQKGQKADSSDTTVGPEVDPNEDEVVSKVVEAAKPQEGKNETMKATTVYKAQEEVQPGQVTVAPEAMAAVPQEGQNVTRRAAPHKTHEDLQQDQRTAEEVATTKKGTRRSTRSKVAAAARKGQKADSSDTTVGPEVDPNVDEVVPKVEEAAKPQEGKNETRKATVYKAQEKVQPDQVTVAPEAMAAVEAEEVATVKRKRRRPARTKVRVAARKGQKADSSDATNEPTVSDDPKKEQVVEVVEEGPTKLNEEEREQISNVNPFASLPKLEDSPILGVVSKPNAAHASDKAAFADEEAIKKDDFTFTGEADLSNLLVNTLDRFAKPICVSTDKEEKKGSECWWMLL